MADETDAWRDMSGDYARLVRKIVFTHPTEVVGFFLRDTVALLTKPTLVSNNPGRELIAHLSPEDSVRRTLSLKYPERLDSFDTARQQSGDLIRIFPETYYQSLTYFSYVILLCIVVFSWARSEKQVFALATAVVVLILLNAAVHGGLAGPFARYNVKVSWLAWIAIFTAGIRLYTRSGVSAREEGFRRYQQNY